MVTFTTRIAGCVEGVEGVEDVEGVEGVEGSADASGEEAATIAAPFTEAFLLLTT
jgi:hypothetical protein